MDERERGRRRNGITVSGNGSAAAAVDQVAVTFGIAVVRPDAGEAFQGAARTSTRVLAILADDGVDSRAVRTADLTLGPQTEWRDNREVLVGYQAGQRLIVHRTGLAGLERMLSDVAVRGGEGVRIENVTLTPSDPAAALALARVAAFADASAKATQLAELAGRSLGEVTWIDERTENGARDIGFVGLSAGGGAAKMPVAAGDSVVTASITAHWSFAE
ncbi:hypothetical protein SAMN04515671_1926 [Nakamurella panacisegetis]|uniref:SIMPL domain-containing protein n=1 Tax=Nakamurella panacisegetis TaxID=1090615 RepID=A0A1H0M5J7_9ACTN|nr:SIMPL domain-containing protein [Nakamurella panacisegetis]SDO75703.1 hypothetical protein SAMN04515671_1926 [Nakamurella panacisegetis]